MVQPEFRGLRVGLYYNEVSPWFMAPAPRKFEIRGVARPLFPRYGRYQYGHIHFEPHPHIVLPPNTPRSITDDKTRASAHLEEGVC